MKTRRTLFALLFFLIYLTNLYGQRGPAWKGRIEIEEGVKAIINPMEPLYGELELELVEDMSIGTDKDVNCLFYKIRDVDIDTDGFIYVLDSGNNRIQVFDNTGKYFRTIGKEGQGPGELNAPVRLQIDDETGHIFVTDRSRRILIFDKEGKYIDQDIHLSDYLLDFHLDSNGCIWGKFRLLVPTTHFIKKVSPTGKAVKTLAEMPYPINRAILSHSTTGNTAYMGAIVFSHGYESDLYLSKVDNHTFVYGYSNEYKLFEVNEAGEILLIIRKRETPREITKDEREQVIHQIRQDIRRRGRIVSEISIDFPKYTPYYYSIVTDNRGRIYVRKNPPSRDLNVSHEYDVFNKEGIYLYKIRLSSYPDVIKEGHVYTWVAAEDTGEEQIKRYKIRNWEHIKDGIYPMP